MRSRIRFMLLSAVALVILVAQVFAQGPARISLLVQLDPGVSRNSVREFAANQGGHVRYEYNILPNVINLRNIPVTALNGLRNVPGVVRIWEDPIIQANLQDSTPLIQGLQDQIQTAGFSVKGEGIRICVPDTGIDSNHWMFQDYPNTGDTRIDYAAALNLIGTGFPEDDQGHGAHVSGIAAGREGLIFNNLPIQGIAPKATIIPVKVLDSAGQGEGSDLIAAFQHCTNPNLPGGPADVISVSLGYGAFSDRPSCDAEPVVQAANAAVQVGAVVVAASGNEGNSSALVAPACGSNVISVGGTWDVRRTAFPYCGLFEIAEPDDVLCFSNKSEMLDVVAPGCGIHSAATDLLFDAPNAVTEMCGTSQAAPHVAGLAALLLQLNPGLQPADVRDCIRNGAEDKGPTGFDPAYGYGRINVTNSLTNCSPDNPTNQPPTAIFTYSCAELTCDFDGSGSFDRDGTIASYIWSFGDGVTEPGDIVRHTYASGGMYDVTLTVTDDDAAPGSAMVSISVNKPPTASFTYECTNLSCTFSSTSYDPDGDIVNYAWAFGDGDTATEPVADHTYTSADTYTVALTVTDNSGATQYTSQPITVSAPPNSIDLSAVGYRIKAKRKADLTWNGATTNKVDVFRNGAKIITTPNDGFHTDSPKNDGRYEYQICEPRTSICSNKATVVFE